MNAFFQEFHHASSARSQAAKDSMAAELEDARRRLASIGMALSVAEGRADSEERGKHAAEATLAKRQQQLAQVCGWVGPSSSRSCRQPVDGWVAGKPGQGVGCLCR